MLPLSCGLLTLKPPGSSQSPKHSILVSWEREGVWQGLTRCSTSLFPISPWHIVRICWPLEVKCGHVPELWTKEVDRDHIPVPRPGLWMLPHAILPLLSSPGRRQQRVWAVNIEGSKCKVRVSSDVCSEESCPGELFLQIRLLHK